MNNAYCARGTTYISQLFGTSQSESRLFVLTFKKLYRYRFHNSFLTGVIIEYAIEINFNVSENFKYLLLVPA